MVNNNRPKILAIIPARGGSKSVKKKNIRELNGKPLIHWTIEAAVNSKFINKIVVSTEDKEIKDACDSLEVEVLDRPMELALDTTSTADVILNVINELEGKGYVPDILLLLQCTSPLRNSKHIDDAISLFLRNIEADSMVSVTKEEHPPWWLKTLDTEGYIKNLMETDIKATRRQDFPVAYRLNGAIYLIKIENFIMHKGFITEKTIPYIMDRICSIDIDTEEEFLLSEIYMKRLTN